MRIVDYDIQAWTRLISLIDGKSYYITSVSDGNFQLVGEMGKILFFTSIESLSQEFVIPESKEEYDELMLRLNRDVLIREIL